MQVNPPSKEEIAQAKIIEELMRRHRCEDKQCSRTPCYITGPNANHVHLTHMLLRAWAAAIVFIPCLAPLTYASFDTAL